MDSNMPFYFENGRGNIFDNKDLKKLVKNNTYSELHEIEVLDVSMKEASVKKERDSMKNKQAAEATNVNQHTARKWKQKYQQNPEEYVPYKMTNLVPSRPVSQLDERHQKHLVSFFDENKRATITDAVDSLTQNFANLEIKKSRVAEFMKEECDLSIKVISRHPTARNSPAVIEKRAVWVKDWMVHLQNCVFLGTSLFSPSC